MNLNVRYVVCMFLKQFLFRLCKDYMSKIVNRLIHIVFDSTGKLMLLDKLFAFLSAR